MTDLSRHGQKWTEEETILAFNLYCQIPFGQIHKSNSQVIELARILKRTPDSVGLKMCNLGHFDPSLRERNVTGMEHGSKLDKEIVDKFKGNWEELAYRAKEIEASLSEKKIEDIAGTDLFDFPEGLTREQIVHSRVNQQFFREAVLSSYHKKCCITGISVTSLLVASHIKPWADSDPKTERTNPSNGLCLNALHDRAFDKGLITVLPDYTIKVSSQIILGGSQNDANRWIAQCDGQKIHEPEKFAPGKEFLEYHNDVIFVG